MDLNTIARVSGLVGGLCWVARFVVEIVGSGTGGVADILYLAGLVLIAVALFAMGAGLVRAVWLGAIVGVAFPLLVWSVLEVLHPAANPRGVDGVFGLLLAATAVVQIARHRPEPRERHRHAGAHSR